MEDAHILVLEDDPDVRSMLTMVLEDHGYKVSAVDRGEKAVALAREGQFDLIIADIRMEGMDGLEAIEHTKRAQPQIGSLVISGYASPEETARASGLEVGGYLTKPFQMEELLGLVRRQLAQRARLPEGSGYLLWSLTTIADLARESGLTLRSWSQAGQRAAELALAWGLSPEVAQELKLATMWSGLRQLSLGPPGELENSLPATARFALSQAESSDSGPEGSVVSLVVEAYRGEDSEDPRSAGSLSHSSPGRWPPELLEHFAREPQEETAPRSAPAPMGSLLAVAVALERAGDLENAEAAYRELSDQSPSLLPGVQAWLGLARLAVARGDVKSAGQQADRAVSLARAKGPVCHARTLLEAGNLMAEFTPERAAEALRRAARLAGECHQSALAATAGVRLACLDAKEAASLPDYLSVLFQPAHRQELRHVCQSHMPRLLALCAGDGPGERFLGRLCASFPGEVAEHLPNLSPQGREGVMKALERLAHLPAKSLLDALLGDSSPDIRRRATDLLSQNRPRASAPLLEVHSTGRMEVLWGGQPVPEADWKTQKVRCLFALLASDWGKSLQDEYLADLLWPDKGEKGRKNLWWATSMIRRCFPLPQGAAPVLERHGDYLRLHPDCLRWHDLEELRACYQAGQRELEAGQTRSAIASLARLAGLYRGPYLDGFYMDWVLEARRDLARLVGNGMATLGRLLLEQEEGARALECGHELLEVNPLSQRGHQIVMRAHLLLGQPEQAVLQFQRCQALLREELDIAPNAELCALLARARDGG